MRIGREIQAAAAGSDPKYPAENLLCQDDPQPWLSCPRDRSGELRAELQLERASAIGYVDVGLCVHGSVPPPQDGLGPPPPPNLASPLSFNAGNCGCAFLQIEVGRSSWPLDRPYLTLVPSVALMTPADSKLGRNRCGVRMFKEADFLALAAGQKWDRLRLTCSQPFSKHGQFGLSFLRVRTPLDPQSSQSPQQSLEDAEPTDGAWRSSPAFYRTFFPEPRSSSREEEELKSRLLQLEPSAWSPAHLSRPARMVLSAARSRALRPKTATAAPGGHPELPGEPEPPALGPAQDVPAAPPRARRPPNSRQSAPGPTGRSVPAASKHSGSGGRTRACSQRQRRARSGDSARKGTGVCPICLGRFSLDLLPVHASSCGEEDPAAARPSSLGAWVSCPICELPFTAAEVEQHASTCGEEGGSPGPPSPSSSSSSSSSRLG
ncbi:putative short transient receptor potential channel 2-like protein isoform X2 [Tyto alba]|uniref:putative short transient receptor potential channel 2-like protein isoform X2 n=1 Tax=Tyto alba TaxID=56313 RepID=UPI001C668CCF|nr:putative short transient receptor potential channel 2-like protein isoform X2 [Tyto alba]